MNKNLLIISSLFFLAACSSNQGGNDASHNLDGNLNQESLISPVNIRYPSEEDRANEVVRIQEYAILLDEMRMSPWITKDGNIDAISDLPTPLSPKLMKERRVGGMALLHLGALNYTIDDNLKVLVKMDGELATVYIEVKIPENSLGPDFTARVMLNAQTGEILSVMQG